MSPERRKRAREVFATVADMPPAERERALEETCDGDAELRSGVESLLERHDSLGADHPGGPDEPLLSPGEIVAGRFQVRRAIGSGGMGEVYECQDLELEQTVALKALRPQAAGSDAAERFKREIQIARSVSHPNVCRVYEYGRHQTASASIDFFIMELVAGETLKSYLDRVGPLTPEQANPLARQVAAGLGALHDCGVVHRDLKPSNILLAPRKDGRTRVVLTDFGIAGPIANREGFGSFATASGQVMGTPLYMAPEQATGLAAGPATDLYAFGVILYEMLTGERPFPDRNRCTDPPQPPSAHNHAVTPDWDRLILDCLQVDLSKRPRSVDTVLEVLGESTRTATPSDAPTVAMPVQPQATRRKWLAPLALLAMLAALVFGVLNFTGPGPVDEGRRVALLPIELASGGPDLQALADGLTDTITGRLSQYESRNEQLLVVPAAEVRKVDVKGADKARGALGVNYVVEARMSAQEDRIRLTLTLIDAKRMVQRETAVINGVRSRALDLEDEAVTRLANLLDLQALPSQVDAIPAVEPGAQEFYLQGIGYLQRSDALESVETAIQLFEKAIAADPSYARSYAGLSQAYLYKRDRTEGPEWVEAAAKAARKAVDLRPDLIEAQTALGYALAAQGDPGEAVRHFNAALELNPRSSEAYAGLGKAYETLARKVVPKGERDEQRRAAEAAYRKAISLRPNDWVTYKRLGLFYSGTGRFKDAMAQYKIITELAPDNAHAYFNMGVFAHFLGDDESARNYLEKTLDLDPDRVSALSHLAALELRDQDYEGAIELFERAVRANPDSHTAWASLGGAYRKLDRHEDADAAYRKAIGLLRQRLQVEGDSLSTHAALAHHYASTGELATARRHVHLGQSSDDGVDQLNLAVAYGHLGERQAALQALKKAIAGGVPLEQFEHVEVLRDILPEVSPSKAIGDR